MFLIDDVFLRALGVSMPGLDLIWLMELMRDLAYREMYNQEEIKDKIKENRMLYEFGEVTEEEYREKEEELMGKLKLARRVDEMGLKVRGGILNSG